MAGVKAVSGGGSEGDDVVGVVRAVRGRGAVGAVRVMVFTT